MKKNYIFLAVLFGLNMYAGRNQTTENNESNDAVDKILEVTKERFVNKKNQKEPRLTADQMPVLKETLDELKKNDPERFKKIQGLIAKLEQRERDRNEKNSVLLGQ